jgi:hypothetical protein
MRELKLSIEQAKEIYSKSDEATKELLLTTFTKQELEGSKYPISWGNLDRIEGAIVDSDCQIIKINKSIQFYSDRNIFASAEMAEASIAMAQLSQLMREYNGDNQEDWCDWTRGSYKYCIYFYEDKLCIECSIHHKSFLAFKDEEKAEHFLKHHRELIEKAKYLL